MITSNKLTVTLNIETMGVTFNNGISTVNKNSYLHNVFAVQPTQNLLPNETLWAVFESEGAVVETKDFILALREVTPLTDTQEVEGGTVTPSTATQEWYIDIPSEIMQNEGEWKFSLAIRVIDDKAKPDVFSQIATTGKYSFIILNSLIGAGAGGTTPNTVDIANLYKEAQGYAENAQTYAEQAQGYAQELSGAIGEIDGFQQQLDNIVDGTTPVAEALNAQTANTAQTAQTANTAQTSATAQFAYEAGKATNDGDGNNIATTYATNTNLALKQNITDQTLNTTAKTIVGAINENATAIAGLKQDFVNEDHFKGFAQTAEDVQAITANLHDFAYCIATGTIWTYGVNGWKNSNEPYPSDATPLSNTTPLQDGTATAGQSTSAARGDHVHPTDTSRASATDLTDHVNDLNNPHEVTAEQVGAYVKPSGGIPETDLSTAVQQALWTNNSIVLTSDTGTLTSEQLKTLTASYGNFIQYGANVYNYNYTDDNNRVYSVQRSINDVDSTTDVIGYFGKVQVDMTSGAYQIYTFTVNNVTANPTLSGSEAELTGLEVAGTKYKVPSGGNIEYATTEDIDGLFAQRTNLLGT